MTGTPMHGLQVKTKSVTEKIRLIENVYKELNNLEPDVFQSSIVCLCIYHKLYLLSMFHTSYKVELLSNSTFWPKREGLVP